MHQYRELRVWQQAKNIAVTTYQITSKFPKEELYGLSSQIRRAAVSIASNIAEGAGRNTKKEFKRFLSIAQGSCYELETQIIIAEELGLIENYKLEPYLLQLNEVQKMNASLQKSLDR